MWSKRNIALIALGIILILALVLPLTNVLAEPYKFLTGKDGQDNQRTQQQEEILPSDAEIPAINSNSSGTEATQLNDNPSAVDNGVAPPATTNGQLLTTAQPPKQVQNAPKQQVQDASQPGVTLQPGQNTQPNNMYQPGPGYDPGWGCGPMPNVPPDYQPDYEWYDNGNNWGNRMRGHW